VMLQAELPESHQTLRMAQLHHTSLLAAIESGEGTRAEALGREHARLARANLEIALRTDRGLAHLPGGRLIRLEEAGGRGR
jgi:GntR family transcriptional regulator of vanillate catabolism